MTDLDRICPGHVFAGGCSTPNCPLQHTWAFCDICTTTYPTTHQKIHINSKRHRRLASQSTPIVCCPICNVRVPGGETWIEHVSSGSHTAVAQSAKQPAEVYPRHVSQTGANYCLLCRSVVPMNTWPQHLQSRHHKKRQSHSLYKAQFENAERDRRGVVVSHGGDGLDFGIVSLADAQRGCVLIIDVSVNETGLSIVELAAFIGNSKKTSSRYVYLFALTHEKLS